MGELTIGCCPLLIQLGYESYAHKEIYGSQVDGTANLFRLRSRLLPSCSVLGLGGPDGNQKLNEACLILKGEKKCLPQ